MKPTQFQLFENSLVQINAKLNLKPYDNLYFLLIISDLAATVVRSNRYYTL